VLRLPATVVVPVGLVVAGCAYLAINDPNDPSALMPRCPTKLVTGLDCPFCGGLRMVHDLLHGQWTAAAHANLVLLLALPVLGLYLARGWLPEAVGRLFARVPGRAYAIGLVVLGIGWMVVRNLPAFPLHPLVG
jgi:hypothetical protein